MVHEDFNGSRSNTFCRNGDILRERQAPIMGIVGSSNSITLRGPIIGFSQKLKIGIFGYLLYFPKIFLSSAGFELHLSLLLGAIAYFCVRNKINKVSK